MTDTRTDSEVRAEDRARVGVAGATDDVEARAVDVPPVGSGILGGRTVRRDTRITGLEEVEVAESRGVYVDKNDRRRIVGAGAPVPPGFSRIEDAPLDARAESAESAAAERDTAGPGNPDPEDKAERGPKGGRRPKGTGSSGSGSGSSSS